jgi:squalene-hopene/tetraprenyl-beta-curcumene cyclase
MKRSTFLRVVLGAFGGLGIKGPALRGATLPAVTHTPAAPAKDRSLQLEIEHAIDKGLNFLRTKQDPNGFWSTGDAPGLSALVLHAMMEQPSGEIRAHPPDFVQKGYHYLLQCQQPDGGIYVKGLANYCTSVSVLALLASGSADYVSNLRRARAFLLGQQGRFPAGSEGEAFDGGIGYGDKTLHFDVSNTSFALEALHATRFLKDSGLTESKELDYGAAVAFLQRCQNLPKYNHQPWVKDDERNLGGFVYEPHNKKALLAYGSMSYAGLLSYIYADVKKDDPRVTAVHDWLHRNYTLDENPGMGGDGLFYYYHMMSKALSVYGTEVIALSDGRQVNWCNDLTLKLLNLQQGDGSWANADGRWWEKDPCLVTAYAVRTLEMIHPQI